MLPFSFVSFAETAEEALEQDGLQNRAYGNENYLNPYDSLNNSLANSRDTTNYNFSGNGTFGGQNNTYNNLNVTSQGALTVQSGATLDNVTINTTLGNTQEMASLIARVEDADDLLAGILYAIVAPIQSSSDSYTVNTSLGSMTIPLLPITLAYYSTSNGVITSQTSQWYCGLGTSVLLYSECIIYNLNTMMQHLSYHINSLRSDLLSASSSIVSAIQDSQSYAYWTLTTDQSGEYYTKTVTNQTGTFHSVILNRAEYIASVLDFGFRRFYEWYCPLDDTAPMYWRYYNTDTKRSENIGLAGLMYNISWYLGNLYVLQSASAALNAMDSAVDSAATTFTNIEAQENAVVNSVKNSIQSFNPSTSDIGALRALPWMSNYLQQIYVSLGTYGIVITVGLLLGVCLRIIRY